MVLPRLIAQFEAEAPALRLAVLIDADNVQASIIKGVLEKTAQRGKIVVKRIYGDFTSPENASFKKIMQQHAIKPVQQFAYTSGKNATDGMFFIDAMDLLYTKKIDGFCLVSSDSDFTTLAIRIREEGLKVYGFGERKTPAAFQQACHDFIFTESMRPSPQVNLNDNSQNLSALKEIDQILIEALKLSSDNNGWVNLGEFGSHLNKLQPDFNPKLYGCKNLSDFVVAKSNFFKIKKQSRPNGKGENIFLQAKKR